MCTHLYNMLIHVIFLASLAQICSAGIRCTSTAQYGLPSLGGQVSHIYTLEIDGTGCVNANYLEAVECEDGSLIYVKCALVSNIAFFVATIVLGAIVGAVIVGLIVIALINKLIARGVICTDDGQDCEECALSRPQPPRVAYSSATSEVTIVPPQFPTAAAPPPSYSSVVRT